MVALVVRRGRFVSRELIRVLACVCVCVCVWDDRTGKALMYSSYRLYIVHSANPIVVIVF